MRKEKPEEEFKSGDLLYVKELFGGERTVVTLFFPTFFILKNEIKEETILWGKSKILTVHMTIQPEKISKNLFRLVPYSL